MTAVILYDEDIDTKSDDGAPKAITTFTRIPGFIQESMYLVETDFHMKIGEFPFCILMERANDAMSCIKSIYNLIKHKEELNYESFYMLPAVGLVCEDRSSCYDLYYWPISSMLYAVDVADQSYVYALLIA